MAEVAQDLFAQNRAASSLQQAQQAARRERLFNAESTGVNPVALNTYTAANEAPTAAGRLAENQLRARQEAARQAQEKRTEPKTQPKQSRTGILKRLAKTASQPQAITADTAGAAVRNWLDRITAITTPGSIFDFSLTTWTIIHVRAFASLPMFKNGGVLPFFHQLRYTDTNLLSSLAPDAGRMRPPRFTPLTAWIALGMLYGLIFTAIAAFVALIVYPYNLILEAGLNPVQLLELSGNPLVQALKPMIRALLP